MPLTSKDIRTNAQLRADGFNPEEVATFRKNEQEYYGLLVDLDDATKKKDYLTLLDIEPRIEELEFRLQYQGIDPKKIPLAPLREYVNRSIKNPATCIRTFCLRCMNDQPLEVKLCPAITCTLWPFRLGKNPLSGKALKPARKLKIEDDDEIVIDENEDGADADN